MASHRERSIPGGALERHEALRYPQRMTISTTPLSIYQLRSVLRSINPLLWRRVLVRSDMTLAYLHTLLQSVFAWSDEHLHSFHIYFATFDGPWKLGGPIEPYRGLFHTA
jgi:hypothetical protein